MMMKKSHVSSILLMEMGVISESPCDGRLCAASHITVWHRAHKCICDDVTETLTPVTQAVTGLFSVFRSFLFWKGLKLFIQLVEQFIMFNW